MSAGEGLCERCRSDLCAHDTHTGVTPGTVSGEDAGCPFIVDGRPCTCVTRGARRTLGSLCADDLGATVELDDSGWAVRRTLQTVTHTSRHSWLTFAGGVSAAWPADTPCEVTR